MAASQSLRLCMVGVVVAILLRFSEAAFNYEVAKRTVDNLNKFLMIPYFPNIQTAKGFSSAILDNSQSTHNLTRQLMYSQIRAVPPSISLLYAGFEDARWIGYYKNLDGHYVFTSVANANATCGNITQACRTYQYVDDKGIPTTTYSTRSYDARTRPWYIASKAQGTVWSEVYSFATTNTLGITFAMQLRDVNGNFLGVVAGDYELSALDTFLREANGNEGRVVYIMDQNGKMVASSVANTSVMVQNNTPTQVVATQSTNSLIRASSQFLQDLDREEDTLFISQGYYIQSTKYVDAFGLRWTIVVMRPSQSASDYISYDSATFGVLCALAVGGILITAALAVYLFHRRATRVWSETNVKSLFLVLAVSVPAHCTLFVLAGPINDGLCVARPWLVTLSTTAICVVLLLRGLDVHLQKQPQQLKLAHRCVVAMCAAQVLALVLWSALDRMQPTSNFREENGVIKEHVTCKSKSLWGLLIVLGIVVILFVGGCVVSYASRQAGSQSRKLMYVFYHGAFLASLISAISLAAGVSSGTISALIFVAEFWFALSTQGLLFVPLMLHMAQFGDTPVCDLESQLTREDTMTGRRRTGMASGNAVVAIVTQ